MNITVSRRPDPAKFSLYKRPMDNKIFGVCVGKYAVPVHGDYLGTIEISWDDGLRVEILDGAALCNTQEEEVHISQPLLLLEYHGG